MSLLSRAKQRYADCKDRESEQRKRFIEDLKFSNPASPEQWDDAAEKLRKTGGRPCLTFDHTNQYIHQVVNDARQNKPGIQVVPVTGGDQDVAEAVSGMIRHIEYQSRAGIAYDTALESAARCGLGWLRVAPIVVDAEKNEQELRVMRVHDVLSVMLGPHTEPDGSDAQYGFVEVRIPKDEFKRRHPKRHFKPLGDDTGDWFGDDLRIVEYYEFEEESAPASQDDVDEVVPESQEDEESDEGATVASRDEAVPRTIRWAKLTGAEVLEETTFPGDLIPIVPVLGDEIWIEGKRYLSGMVRRMMDSQRSYNYLRSAEIEAIALQPKAPFIIAAEAVEGFEGKWGAANASNDAYLPWNHLDEQGNSIPMPQRQLPPQFPAAWAQASQQAQSDMQAGVGMYKSNLGQESSSKSGVAKRQDQIEGDTANFHYMDNLARSIEQLGRIIVSAIPTIYDTKRQARILQENGNSEEITVDPNLRSPKKRVRGALTINPTKGSYSVRVKVGPAYTTLRQQTAESLSEILRTSPQLLPILGPYWARMQDFPESDKLSKLLLSMAPPPVQAIEQGDKEIPAEYASMLAQKDAQLQQFQQQLQEAGQAIQTDQVKNQAAIHQTEIKAQVDQGSQQVDMFKAQTERMALQAQVEMQQRQQDREDLALQLKVRELDIKEADTMLKHQPAPDMGNPITDDLDNAQKMADVEQTHAETQKIEVETARMISTPIEDPNAVQEPKGEE